MSYIYIYIYIYDISSQRVNDLTLILLTWRKSWANNASKWHMGFNTWLKELKNTNGFLTRVKRPVYRPHHSPTSSTDVRINRVKTPFLLIHWWRGQWHFYVRIGEKILFSKGGTLQLIFDDFKCLVLQLALLRIQETQSCILVPKTHLVTAGCYDLLAVLDILKYYFQIKSSERLHSYKVAFDVSGIFSSFKKRWLWSMYR
jgi:hypothetical protein